MNDVRVRMGVVGVIVAVLFTTLFGRLSYLQLVEGDKIETRIANQLVTSQRLPTVRGQIFDRHNRLLVSNRVIHVVNVDKGALAKRDRVPLLTRLAGLLQLPYSTLSANLDSPSADPTLPVPVARGVRESAVVYIAEHAERFPAVTVTDTSVRAYSYGSLAAHLLGYVGRIQDDNEIRTLDPAGEYDVSDVVGKTGVERSMETTLRGKPGERKVQIDRLGRVVKQLSETPPVPGDDVYLTIDIDAQRNVEESLLDGLKIARTAIDPDSGKPYQATAGAAVVLDLTDGSVVAMASYPTYNPEDIVVSGISPALLDPRSHQPLVNRVIGGLYPPASTFKPFTSIAALAAGVITAYTPYNDQGVLKLKAPCGGRCTFRNAGSTPHGVIDLRRALTVSSDTFFFDLGRRFNEDRGVDGEAVQKVAKSLGMGGPTGIDLPYETTRSRIPTRETKLALHNANKRAFPDGTWRTGDMMNTAVGQGETVITPLQLAVAYGSLATDGSVIDPKIVLDTESVARLQAAERTAQRQAASGSAGSAAPSPAVVPGGSSPSIGQALLPAAAMLPVVAPAATTTTPASAAAVGAANAAGAVLIGPPADAVPTAPVTTTPPTIAGAPTTVAAVDSAGSDPVLKARYTIGPNLLSPVIDGLRGAVADPAGTAYDAFSGFPLNEYPIIGKTGTAQTGSKRQDNAVFAAFGPWPNPKYAVVVVMEHAGFGGKVAAPVARRIFEGLFNLPRTPVRIAAQTAD